MLSEPLKLKDEALKRVTVPEENAPWKSVFPLLRTVILPPAKWRTFGLEVAARVPVARVTLPVADTELMSISGEVRMRVPPVFASPVRVAVPAPIEPLLA